MDDAVHRLPGAVLCDAKSSPHHQSRCLELQPPGVIASALAQDAAAKRIVQKGSLPKHGSLVGVRLNLNFLKTTGLPVHTLHKGTNKSGYREGRGFWNGEVLGYEECVVLKHAYFNVGQKARESIASGHSAKYPMASIDGELVRTAAPHDFTGVEISFNPKREHLFVDQNGQAVWYAQEVTIFAHRAYARGVIAYHTNQTAPQRAGTTISRAIVFDAHSEIQSSPTEQQVLFA